MARIVDVPTAIEALEYPADLEGSVRIGVEDPLVDWNDATFEVSFEDGTATCRQVEAEPAVECSIAHLSQLYVGYRSLDRLQQETALTIADDAVTARLDGAFPPRNVFLREGF
jgi:predicted acetyltransferase